MKIFIELAIFMSFWIVGDLVSSLISPVITIPGAIVGMLLLFVAMLSGLLKEHHIKNVGDFLLNNIAFFFLPASAGLMVIFAEIQGALLKLLIIAVISTFLTMLVTMLVTHLFTRLTK